MRPEPETQPMLWPASFGVFAYRLDPPDDAGQNRFGFLWELAFVVFWE